MGQAEGADLTEKRMNKGGILQSVELMERNIVIYSYCGSGSLKMGDPERRTLNVISTVDDRPYYLDSSATIGTLTNLLRMPPVMTRWRIHSCFTRAPLRCIPEEAAGGLSTKYAS